VHPLQSQQTVVETVQSKVTTREPILHSKQSSLIILLGSSAQDKQSS